MTEKELEKGTYVQVMDFYKFNINENDCRCIVCNKLMHTKPNDLDSDFEEPFWVRINRNQYGALCEKHYVEIVSNILKREQ